MEIMSAVGERSSESESRPSMQQPDRAGQIPGSSSSPDDGTLVFSTVKHLPFILRLIKISFDQNISLNIKGED
jgi:hypothetical protein